MSSSIFTPKQMPQVDNLLNKSIPSYRQAYSDRTAFIMACLSELAYLRFNPLFAGKANTQFNKLVNTFLKKKKKGSLTQLIATFSYDHNKEKTLLTEDLKGLRFKLEKTFDNEGTQAILISSTKFIALAFRGTETVSIKDIKADLKVIAKTCETGGKIHSGFNDAYAVVEADIQRALNNPKYSNLPLFITGHSLGGALATVATKKLLRKGGIAACYTFGSPRVGNDEWVYTIKSPIYRVVNATDCVTMLPPPNWVWDFVIGPLLKLLSWTRIIPLVGLSKLANQYISKMDDYMHCGDMRYLSDCPAGDYQQVQLLPAVSSYYRICTWWNKKSPWTKFLADHKMSTYRKKLMIIAERRNASPNTTKSPTTASPRSRASTKAKNNKA